MIGKVYTTNPNTGTPWCTDTLSTDGNVQFVKLMSGTADSAVPIQGTSSGELKTAIYGQHSNANASEIAVYPIGVDFFSPCLLTMTFDHHHIHEARMFETCHYATSLANNATMEFLIVTPAAGEAHLELIEITSDVDLTLELKSGVTATASNPAVNPSSGPTNCNFNSSNTSGTAITMAPTGVSGGKTRSKRLILAGKTSISMSRGSGEYALLINSKHTLTITNIGGANGKISVMMRHYEHGTPTLENRGY